jgi:hypothetical protein
MRARMRPSGTRKASEFHSCANQVPLLSSTTTTLTYTLNGECHGVSGERHKSQSIAGLISPFGYVRFALNSRPLKGAVARNQIHFFQRIAM